MRLMDRLEAEGKAKAAQYHSQQATLRELATQTSAAEEDLWRIERDLKRLPALQGHEATLAKAIQDAQEAEGQLQEQEQALLALQQQLERREFAVEEQAQNAALEARIAALGYGPADVPALAEGAFAQQRPLAMAPRSVSKLDLETIYRDAMHYW